MSVASMPGGLEEVGGSGDRARIAVLVSGGGTNLQALIDAQARGEIPHGSIELVISNRPGVFALERAERHGIPTRTFASRGSADFQAQEDEIVDALELAGIDLIVLAGFLRILSRRFTDRFAGRIINVHPSLIPSFCGEGMYGLRVHEAALECGVKVTGATVHFVNEVPDGGEIIAQKPVAVKEGDTPEELQRRVMEEAEWVILPQAAEQVARWIVEHRDDAPLSHAAEGDAGAGSVDGADGDDGALSRSGAGIAAEAGSQCEAGRAPLFQVLDNERNEQ